MEGPHCCNFRCTVRLTPHGRALPAPHSRPLQRVRSPGRGLLRELPHVLRRGHDRVLAGGVRGLRRADRGRHRRDGGRGPDPLPRLGEVRRRDRPGGRHQPGGDDLQRRRRDRVERAVGRRGTGGGRASPRVRGRPDAREAGAAGARARGAGSGTQPRPGAPRRSASPDDPPSDRRAGGRSPTGARAPLRLAVGAERGAPPRAPRKPGRRPDPLRRRARGRQRDHQRPQGAPDPARGVDRRRAHRHVDLRRGGRGREGGAGAALRRRGLGGGRGAHLREHRALVQLRAVHGRRHADRGGRDRARPADPDRGGDGRGARVRAAGGTVRGARRTAAASSRAARSPRWPWASRSGSRALLSSLVLSGRAVSPRSSRAPTTRSPISSPTRTSWFFVAFVAGSPGCSRSPRRSRALWWAC